MFTRHLDAHQLRATEPSVQLELESGTICRQTSDNRTCHTIVSDSLKSRCYLVIRNTVQYKSPSDCILEIILLIWLCAQMERCTTAKRDRRWWCQSASEIPFSKQLTLRPSCPKMTAEVLVDCCMRTVTQWRQWLRSCTIGVTSRSTLTLGFVNSIAFIVVVVLVVVLVVRISQLVAILDFFWHVPQWPFSSTQK